MILRCTHCERRTQLTQAQAKLMELGLYPHRCAKCGNLCPQVKHQAVKEVYSL